jgi:hypothetical protein
LLRRGVYHRAGQRPDPLAPRNDGSSKEARMPGNRNLMFLIIGALIVVVGVLGYNLYEAKKEPKGVQINVGPDGLKIQNK